jgi:hypothetical protein
MRAESADRSVVTEAEAAVRPARRPVVSSSAGVTLLSLVLVGLGAVFMTVPGPHHDPLPTTTYVPWWMLAVLVAMCELVVLHIQVRREAHAISLSELATILGVFFTPPGEFVLGRCVGALLVFVVWRRQAPVKALFNVALYFAESWLALLVFYSIQRGTGLVNPLGWIAALATAVAVGVLTGLAVTVVIAIVDRDLRVRDLMIEPFRGALTSIGVTAVALVTVQALASDPLRQ